MYNQPSHMYTGEYYITEKSVLVQLDERKLPGVGLDRPSQPGPLAPSPARVPLPRPRPVRLGLS
jgi:hypothetical protein